MLSSVLIKPKSLEDFKFTSLAIRESNDHLKNQRVVGGGCGYEFELT